MPSGNPCEPAIDALPALVERGWISVIGPGLIRCAGPFAALCAYFDATFAEMARRRGAVPHVYPGVVSRELLERFDYFTSFPGVATSAGEGYVMAPAVCYQSYELLAGRVLEKGLQRISVAGRCSRNEGAALTGSPERLRDFTMRELVFFGTAAEVARERKALMRNISVLLAKHGMAGSLTLATDPFFVGESRGKFLLQKLKELKHELRVPIREGVDLAVASFNHHEEFFTGRMNIRLPDGATAASGCVAFGIERWSYAFLCQNGMEAEGWPAMVKRFVGPDSSGAGLQSRWPPAGRTEEPG